MRGRGLEHAVVSESDFGQQWVRLAALLLGLGLAFVLAEGALRVLRPTEFAPGPSDLREFVAFDSRLGWTNRPGSRGRMRFGRDFDVSVEISAEGLRGRVFGTKRTPGRRRILCVGDSFTWGTGVEAAETWPKVLEERIGPAGEVINAGVNGWGTAQELLWLEERGARFAPDLVILGFYVNDFSENSNGGIAPYLRPYFELREGRLEERNTPVPGGTVGVSRTFAAYLQNRFWIARVGSWSWLWFRDGFLRKADVAPLERVSVRARAASEPPPAPSLTAALLREMKEHLESCGARFLVLLIPSNVLVRPVLGTRARRAPDAAAYDTAIELCAREGIRAVDPRARLTAREEAGERLYFDMDMHWNAAGHRAAAEVVLTALGEHRLLPAAAATEPRRAGEGPPRPDLRTGR